MRSSFKAVPHRSVRACEAFDKSRKATAADRSDAGAHARSEALLWKRFVQHPNACLREELILLHLPYAKAVAAGMFGRHVRQEIDFEDFLQWAIVGMIEALDRYDADGAASFRTFALPRMRGAIMDGLEQISERQSQSGLLRQLSTGRGREPVVDSLDSGNPESERSGCSMRRLAEMGVGAALQVLLADTGMLPFEAGEIVDPCLAALQAKDLRTRVGYMLRHLTPRERSVMNLHYLQGLGFHEISKLLAISKGRVSQLHEQAKARLLKAFPDAQDV